MFACGLHIPDSQPVSAIQNRWLLWLDPRVELSVLPEGENCHRMLKLSNRAQFRTLLDAVTFTHENRSAFAITYLETGVDPVHLTRDDFVRSVVEYAEKLQALGVRPRELVIIAHTQNLESILAFWACLMLDAIPSMFPTLTEKLDPDYYITTIAQVVRHAQAQAILTTDEFAPVVAQHVECLVWGPAVIHQHTARALTHSDPAPDQTAFLQHSSGTTGLQKGVALSHRAVLNQVASYSDAIDLTPDDVVVSWLPLYHDMGLIAGFLIPLIQGIPLVLMSPFDWVKHPAMLLSAITTYQGTLCWLPNFAYNHCTRRIRKHDINGMSLASMRAFVNCSEPVVHDSHVQFFERFAAIGATMDMFTVSYAMAENTFAVTQTSVNQTPQCDIVDRASVETRNQAVPLEPDAPTAQVNVSCGRPIEGVEVVVLDGDGNELPERAIGEIAIHSSFMLNEYYRRPDLNETLFDHGWYRTGDMGYITSGEVYITGRKKDLIITGGKNIFPQDLEAIVNTVEGVHAGRAVVFGVYDEREGTELIGVVVEADAVSVEDQQRIKRDIRQKVATQSTVTASFVHLVADKKWIIKTSSGKLARNANRDKWLAEVANAGQ